MIENFLAWFIPEAILKQAFLGNHLERYIVALVIFFSLFVIFRVFRKIILVKIKDLSTRSSIRFDDILVSSVEKIPGTFYALIALYFALVSLKSSERVTDLLDASLLAIIVYQIIISSQDLLRYFVRKAFKVTEAQEDITALNGIMLLVNIIIWSLAFLMVLSNFGINVASLIASLGIGGIAVALAAQNILGDMFSSFSIYFDKPFVVGDFIVVNDKAGNVENIGLKTTRISSLSGEQIVLSNQELTKAVIHNYKKMPRRRVLFTLGVTYSTSLEKCKKASEIITNIIHEFPDNVTFDRVNFFQFADSSLNYEIVYFHNNGDYNDYMLYREKICLRIKEEFEKAGIEMAFPTRTLYIERSE